MKQSFLKRLERVERRHVLWQAPGEALSGMEVARRVAFVLAAGAQDVAIEPPTEMFKLARRLAEVLAKRPARGTLLTTEGATPMAVRVKPGAFMRRGTAGLSAVDIVTLLEHKDELEGLYESLDARRDAALEATAESETKLAELTLRSGDLQAREAALAAGLADLEPREAEVARFRQALKEVAADMEAAHSYIENSPELKEMH